MSVVVGADRYDVVGDPGLTVGDAMRLLRPDADLTAVTMSGSGLRRDDVLATALSPGSLILATSPVPHRPLAGVGSRVARTGPDTSSTSLHRTAPTRARPVLLTCLCSVAGFALLAYGVLVQAIPPGAASALLLASAVLVSRVAPQLVLRVNRDLLLDLDDSSSSARVDRRLVEDLVRTARAGQTAVLTNAAAFAVLALVGALTAGRPSPSPAYRALFLVAGIAFSSVARGYRRPVDRHVVGLVGAACVVAAALLGARHLAEVPTAVTVMCLVVGLTVVLALLTVTGGSAGGGSGAGQVRPPLWMVRVAHALGGLSLVVVPSLSLWAAGVTDAVWSAAAGWMR